MKKITFLAFIALATACNSTQKTTTVAKPAVDISHVAAKFPGYKVEDFQAGKTAYETKCAKCHALKDPKKFTEAKLMEVTPEMVKMTNNKGGNISSAEEQQILRYLITAATSK